MLAKHDIPIVGPAVARVLQQLALTINAKTVFEWARPLATRPSGGRKRSEKTARLFTLTATENADRARPYWIAPAFPAASRSTPATPSNFSPSRSSSTTSSSTMSTKRISPRSATPRRGCARAAVHHRQRVWSGRVAEKNPDTAQTKAILSSIVRFYNSADFYTTILPIRDGMAAR